MRAIGKVPSRAKREEYAKRTKYYRNGKFHNVMDRPLMVKAHGERSRERVPKYRIPVVKQTRIPAPTADLAFYWLGHSSILIQMAGKNILIDPMLTKYCSPFDWVGVKRYSEIPIQPQDLPKIDVLLISHDHYDHLDYQTIRTIRDKVNHILVPLGVESFLKSWGIPAKKITALSWWESVKIGPLEITATPAQHFANRNPLHSNAAWWCGFCIRGGEKTVYYSGDGGYSEAFREIGERFDVDLAFLECGQYNEAWPYCHMFPEESAQAAVDVEARWCVPVHWGSFCLCNSAWNDSPIRIVRKAGELGANVATPKIGERVEYRSIESHREEWYRSMKREVLR